MSVDWTGHPPSVNPCTLHKTVGWAGIDKRFKNGLT